MLLRKRFVAPSTAGIILASSIFAFTQTSTTAALKSGYAPVDGLKMYYEIYGTGKPLILLHGGLGSTDTFSRDGWYPEIVAGMTKMGADSARAMTQTPMYQLYAHIAPRPEDWPVLH